MPMVLRYENFILMWDFNTEEQDADISNFLETYNLKKLMKKPTCFKSDRPRSIDLILTNRVSTLLKHGTSGTSQ